MYFFFLLQYLNDEDDDAAAEWEEGAEFIATLATGVEVHSASLNKLRSGVNGAHT